MWEDARSIVCKTESITDEVHGHGPIGGSRCSAVVYMHLGGCSTQFPRIKTAVSTGIVATEKGVYLSA
jgi:hypothetical protein